MKKDFYSILGISLFFLILAGLRLGPQVIAWRKLAFYLIHPTAGTFLSAYREAGYLSDAWHDLFESRKELEALRANYKRLQFLSLKDRIDKNAEDTQAKLEELEARARQGHPGLNFHPVQVVYRGIGEKMWSTMACVRGSASHDSAQDSSVVTGWPEGQPALQFHTQQSRFVLIGKTLPLASRFGSFPCVELITSESFAVAVQVASTGESAVIRGRGRPDLVSLEYLPKDSSLKVGDAVTTSPLSLFVPAGIAVGEVVEIEAPSPAKIFLTAYVRPYIDIGRISEFVVMSK